jgi:hypothetical protein
MELTIGCRREASPGINRPWRCGSRHLLRRRRRGLQSADALPIQRPQGRVAEWLKAAVLKTARGASPSWVRIPPLPPICYLGARASRVGTSAMKPGKIRISAFGVLFVAAGLASTSPTSAAAQSGGHRGTPEEQAACTPDVFRLCFSSIPSEQEIVACLIRSRRQLSPGCGRVFGVKPRSATTVARAKPRHPATVAGIKPKPKSKKIVKKPRPAKPVPPTPQPIPMRT